MAFASCNSVDNNGIKGLSQTEIDYLRAKVRAKCLSDSADAYEDFTIASNAQYSSFYRNQTWKAETKKAGAVTITYIITVWKVTATDVFFVITFKDGNGNPKTQFLKVPAAQNIAMIADLKAKKCSRTTSSNYEVNEGNSIASIKTTILTTGSSANTYDKVTSNLTLQFDNLVYFGRYVFTRTIQETDLSEHNTSTAAENYTGTLSEPYIFAPKDAYTEYSNIEYCVLPETTTGPPPTYDLPYTDFLCHPTATVGPAGWTAPTPATDLGTY